MTTVTQRRTLPHAPSAVWDALADFGGIYRFHPLVERSPIVDGTPERGLGASRTCHFYDGNHIVEKVVGYEEGRQLEVDVVEGSMPLSCARAVLEVEPTADGGTTLTMQMRYEPKFGLLGKAMDKLMIRRKFSSILDTLLRALDEHLTSGQIIDQGWRPTKAA